MKNAIFTTFDDNYFVFALRFLNSIKKNYPNHPLILIYYTGNDENTIKKINDYSNVKIILFEQENESIKGLSFGVVGSAKIFIRYILWSNKFDEFENILHLDIDLVILKPLDNLINKSDFFCVSDHSNTPAYRVFYPEKSNDQTLLNLLRNDGIKLPDGQDEMINAGVFLIPQKYRNQIQENLLWEITYKYNDYMMFADQSAISLWCHYNKIPITTNYEYNFQASFFYSDSFFYDSPNQLLKALNNIHIYHFSWWKPQKEFYNRFLYLSEEFLKLEKIHKEFEKYD